jgi:hypothetical protein
VRADAERGARLAHVWRRTTRLDETRRLLLINRRSRPERRQRATPYVGYANACLDGLLEGRRLPALRSASGRLERRIQRWAACRQALLRTLKAMARRGMAPWLVATGERAVERVVRRGQQLFGSVLLRRVEISELPT